MSATPTGPRVIVAGGGLVGLATAWYLRERGCRVKLVDAGRVGRQASWAGGGILFPIYPWKYPSAIQQMAQCGRAIYETFTQRVDAISGIDSENRRTGLCVLDAAEASAARDWARTHDEPIVDLDEAAPTDVQCGVEAAGGVYFPNAAQVSNPRLCQSLRAALIARGVEIVEHCRVVAISQAGGHFAGFETARHGRLKADFGVVACGAWSQSILESITAINIFPVKGQMILLRGVPGLLRHVLLSEGRYAIPRRDGLILVGSTVEHAGFDTRTDEATAEALRASACRMLPALAKLPLEAHWAGLRPATPDELPLVGPIRELHGLYVNAGHYRNGVLCAPVSAECLVHFLCKVETAARTAFDPGRFAGPDGPTSKCR